MLWQWVQTMGAVEYMCVHLGVYDSPWGSADNEGCAAGCPGLNSFRPPLQAPAIVSYG
jgi:hypothetical protein